MLLQKDKVSKLPTTLDVHALWKGVQAEMELTLSELHYRTFIEQTRASKVMGENNDELEVLCASPTVKKRIKKYYQGMIHESLRKLGKRDFKITYKVHDLRPVKEPVENTPLFKAFSGTENATIPTAISTKAGLNPKFTFDNYIMGDENHLAYAIATAVSENPGRDYNPFFIHSGVGLGKTHLLQAIGNKVLQEKPNTKVIYCTGESFTNELIEALQKGKRKGSYTSDTFRKKYRKADLLLIDDIQFIVGKEKTQEEFYHTFNSLHMKQKQIVLASDRPPEEFKNIEERLTSRFKSGIMADMQAPNYELRSAILRAERDRNAHSISNEIIDFIVEVVDTNVRELVGAYRQVLTHAKASKETLTLDLAKLALENIAKPARNKPVNINHILKSVCNYYSVTQADVKGKRRTKNIVIPRQIAMYLIHDIMETPYTSIGAFLGGRDHTTVLHGVKKIEGEMRESTKAKQEIGNIRQYIYQN